MEIRAKVALSLPNKFYKVVLKYDTFEKATYDSYLVASIAANAKNEKDAMEYIDDDMLEDVNTLRSGSPRKRSRIWMQYVSAAACVCIVLGGLLVWHRLYDPAENESAYYDNEAVPEMMPEEEKGFFEQLFGE